MNQKDSIAAAIFLLDNYCKLVGSTDRD